MSATTSAADRNERTASILIALAYRAPLPEQETRAYETKLLARVIPSSLQAASLLRARHVALVARSGMPCSLCDARKPSPSAFVLSMITDTYDLRSRSPTCVLHTAQLLASHFLLTLPARSAAGGPWSEDAIRAALRCISDGVVCVALL